MKIENNHVVSMHYTLKSDAGEIIDTSAGRDPLDYIQGKGMIVPGLEKAMLGHAIGEKFNVTVIPSEGYGEYVADLVQEVPLEAFQGVPAVEVGMTFVAHGPHGPMMIAVKEVREKTAVIDGNHELAGKNLNFEVEVAAVRVATEDELSNGLHAEHGCCGGGCGCHDEEGSEEDSCCHGTKHDDPDHECCGKGDCCK